MLTGNFLLSIYCLVIGAFFLVIFNTGNNALIITPLVIIIIFMLTYGMTVGPLVWLYVPEIIPPRIVPFATFSYWFGVATSVTITPIVIDEVGSPYPLFFFFGGLSFIFFIMNCFLVVETKGLKSTDVQKWIHSKALIDRYFINYYFLYIKRYKKEIMYYIKIQNIMSNHLHKQLLFHYIIFRQAISNPQKF